MSDNNVSNSWNLNLTNTTFNLVTEPWIPVIYTDGNTDTVSLETFFINADKIRALYSVDMYVEVAIFNLLLSIRDVAYAHKGCVTSGYDSNIIRDYFEKRVEWNSDLIVADLFDIYDPKHPFLQVPWESDLLRTTKQGKTVKMTVKRVEQLYLPLNTDNKASMWARSPKLYDADRTLYNGKVACYFLGFRLYHPYTNGSKDSVQIENGTHTTTMIPFFKVSNNFKGFFERNFLTGASQGLPIWEQNTPKDNQPEILPADKNARYKKVQCKDLVMARMHSNILLSLGHGDNSGLFRFGANSPLELFSVVAQKDKKGNVKKDQDGNDKVENKWFERPFNLASSNYIYEETYKTKINMTKNLISLVKDKNVTLHEGDDFIFITPPETNKAAFVKLPEVAHTFHCAIKNMSAFDANKASTTFERVSKITNGFEKHMRKLRCDKIETFVEQAENEVAVLLEKGLSSFVREKDGNIRPNIENELLKEVKSVYRRTEKDALKLYGTAEMFGLIETCDKDDEYDNGNKLFSKNEYAITDIEAKTPKTWEMDVADDTIDNCEITRTPSRVLKSLRDYELIPTVVKDNLKFYVDGNDEFYNLRRFKQSLGLPKDLLYVNDRELIEEGIALAEYLFVPVAKNFTQETLSKSFYGTKRGFGRLMADISYYLAKENNLDKFEQYDSKYKSCLKRNDVYGLARLMKRMVDVWVSHSEDPTKIPLNFGELAYKFYRALKDDRELNVIALETLDGFGYRVMKKETKTK